MAAMVCLVGMTRDAGATVTFSLLWTSTSGGGTGVGTDTITALPGDTIELQIRMVTNQTLSAHFVSLGWDTDLANELDVLGFGNWSGSSFGTGTMNTNYAPLGTPNFITDSSGAVAGRINTYNSALDLGPLALPTGTYSVGTARFVVTGNVTTDGLDVFIGLLDKDDVVGDNTATPIPVSALVFNSASVNVIPEPGTVSLLGLGLVGLVLAGRRSRRS
jgi:hypothetical protein